MSFNAGLSTEQWAGKDLLDSISITTHLIPSHLITTFSLTLGTGEAEVQKPVTLLDSSLILRFFARFIN